jgi:hypothetical protein
LENPTVPAGVIGKPLIILKKFFWKFRQPSKALVAMSRERMAIAGEETMEAGEGFSGLSCRGAASGALALHYDEERLGG